MKPNSYAILRRAVEDGIATGLRRARKHTDNPDSSAIYDSVVDSVMLEISEVFTFDDDSETQVETKE